MIGIGDREYLAIRFESFAREVLDPLVHPERCAVELAVFQSPERVSLDEAIRADYSPMDVGFRWGPVWSTAWFRIRVTVPSSMAGQRVALRFSSGTEALWWRDGVPVQGLDENRGTAVVLPDARGGESLELFVEAACNLPLGVTTFFWDDPEVHRRWAEERPGRVDFAELVTVDDTAWRFVQAYDFARDVALSLPEDSARGGRLLNGLRDLSNSIPARDPRSALDAARASLSQLLTGQPTPDTTCYAVGHGHLDTGWLWPIRETRRKLLRTFTNVLRLMDRFPRFHFVASQAQQYAFLEEESPAVFEEVRTRVAEGRFEAAGAMWVEPDAQVPSGESLVRQILYGVRYFRDRFGADLEQRVLYLPDTFGFPASLPQIMKAAGLDTFITNKMSWCERNAFPFTTFRWRGVDGSEVLTHFTPGNNYNAPLRPEDLNKGEANLRQKDHRVIGHAHRGLDVWLQPYGFGDGGGGPNDVTAMRAELAENAQGVPRVKQGGLHAFRAALLDEHQVLRDAGHELPVWDGELYLELHRGTFTSQGWLKRANAEAEARLREVEALIALTHDPEFVNDTRSAREDAWRKVLLHQFHDILPGTSIAEVYEEARADHAEVDAVLTRLQRRALEHHATRIGVTPAPDGSSSLVFNPSSTARTGWVQRTDGQWIHMDDVPPLAITCIAPAPELDIDQAVRVTERTLENEHLRVTLDEAGRVAHLDSKGLANDLHLVDGEDRQPLNQLVVYEDRPRRWEAWDLDFDHEDKPTVLDTPADAIEIEEFGPHRGTLKVTRLIHDSTLVQRYRLTAGQRHLIIETHVDWQEECTLLRAQFPVAVRARHATYGIQFGAVERPTHRNTSHEEARFEVPGHRWMDLSQPGLGLAVLDDGKFGRSCRDQVLSLSLLRSPRFPDPGADRGEHHFTYALYPHAGDWRAADVPVQAEQLRGMTAVPIDEDSSDSYFSQPCRIVSDLGAAPEIAALKPAEDGPGFILRLVEPHGGNARWNLHWPDTVTVEPVDLLEHPASTTSRAPGAVQHDPDGRTTTVNARPFQILSLRVTPT